MKTLAQHLKAQSIELGFLIDELSYCIEDPMDSYDAILKELHMTFNDDYLQGQAFVLLALAQQAKKEETDALISYIAASAIDASKCNAVRRTLVGDKYTKVWFSDGSIATYANSVVLGLYTEVTRTKVGATKPIEVDSFDNFLSDK